MDRRDFLKLLGLTGGAATVAAAGVAQAASASGTGIRPNADAVGVLHDSTLCIGCRKCEEACATVNERPKPRTPFADLSVLDKKRRPTVDSYTVVNKYASVPGDDRPVFRKQQCNHCLEPACASACFVKAFVQNPDGSVTYKPHLCVGCRYCMVACPFNVPSYEYNKALYPLVHKCTLCEPRLRQGKLPGCVEGCPTGALLFGKRTELLRIARERIAQTPQRYVSHIYGETEMGGTNWLYLSPVPHRDLGQPELGRTSVPELTAGALGAVPLVAGLWPVLLTGAYAMTKRKEKIAAQEQSMAVRAAVEAAEEKAAKDKAAALAKAEKDKETALAKTQKEQAAALQARDEALAAAEKARDEATAQLEEAQKAARAAAIPAASPGGPSAKAKPAPAKNAGTRTPAPKKPSSGEEDA